MRAPKWSDDELRTAIRGARSWRGTARVLGLKVTNATGIRAIKRRATELDVDTSHFTFQRTWSDKDLRHAVEISKSWTAVIENLGLRNHSSQTRLIVKGHAVRLGLDVTHLQPRTLEAECDLSEVAPILQNLRHAAESYATAWFAMRGIPVAAPAQPAAYDLLATFDGRVQRVQVKTTTRRVKHGSWCVEIGQRPYVLDKSASRQPYDPDDLDYFFVIDGDLDVYLIPSQVVAGYKAISVGAYQVFKVGNAAGLMAS